MYLYFLFAGKSTYTLDEKDRLWTSFDIPYGVLINRGF